MVSTHCQFKYEEDNGKVVLTSVIVSIFCDGGISNLPALMLQMKESNHTIKEFNT